MRTLKLKTICNLSASAVHNCLQHPAAKLEMVGNVRTVEITDIPEDVKNADVLKAWNETADASWLGNDGEYRRHSFQFAEIGGGRIIW
ncbi:MAG TPA: hypothetical protein VJQ59_05030 [Candidatus Sulfotelmatobacter sp.]|nr:hypothetical protein [Candidatus Sulfotelmatobacter sp.]